MTKKTEHLVRQTLSGEFDNATKIQADSICIKILSEFQDGVPPIALRAMRRITVQSIKPEAAQ